MITPRKVQPVVISLDFGTSHNIHSQTRIHTHKHTHTCKDTEITCNACDACFVTRLLAQFKKITQIKNCILKP